jgi:hypothetical protein
MSIVRRFETAFNKQDLDGLGFDEGIALLQLGFAPESLAKVLRKRL